MAEQVPLPSRDSPPTRSPSATESDVDHVAVHIDHQPSISLTKALPKGFELLLPLGRVKKIIKQDREVKAVSTDANYAIAKAAEMMIEALVESAASKMLSEERILLAYNDVATAVKETEHLQFLREIVPRKMPVEALSQHLERFQE